MVSIIGLPTVFDKIRKTTNRNVWFFIMKMPTPINHVTTVKLKTQTYDSHHLKKQITITFRYIIRLEWKKIPRILVNRRTVVYKIVSGVFEYLAYYSTQQIRTTISGSIITGDALFVLCQTALMYLNVLSLDIKLPKMCLSSTVTTPIAFGIILAVFSFVISSTVSTGMRS